VIAAASSTWQPLALGGAAAFAAWLAVAALAAFITRPRAASASAATGDFGPESPALAGFAADRWEVTPRLASATLLDLAARRVVDLEQITPDQVLCRYRDLKAGRTEFARHEQLILDLIRRRMSADHTVATSELWVDGNWMNRFGKAVVAQGKELGLIRPRWSRPLAVALGGSLLVPIGFLAAAFDRWNSTRATTHSSDSPAFALVLFGWMGVMWAGTAVTRSWRETPAGLELAGRWLGVRAYLRNLELRDAPAAAVAVWDRNLSYAAAFGLARNALDQVPLGGRDDRHAWSAYGGLWREVRIKYPHRFGYGQSPSSVLFFGLARLIGGGAVAGFIVVNFGTALLDVRDGVDNTRFSSVQQGGIIAVVAVALIIPLLAGFTLVASGGLRVSRAALDLTDNVTIRGQIIRMADRNVAWRQESLVPYVAVDPGQGDELLAFVRAHGGLSQGEVVDVTHTRRLRYVRSITAVPSAGVAGSG
jgi:hypothetical protein